MWTIGWGVWLLGAGLAGPVSVAAPSKARLPGGRAVPPGVGAGGLEHVTDLDRVLSRLRMQLRRKRYRGLLGDSKAALVRFPDSPDVHALRAVALAELGDFPTAAQRLSDGLGAREAEVMSVVARADVLRHLGEPGDAAEVRRELLASGDSPNREQVMLLKLFEDHRVDGDLEGMWAAATSAMAVNPNSAVPYALMARYYTAAGDETQADEYLWLTSIRGGRTAAEGIARVEYALAFDSPDDAWLVADENRELVLRSKEFTVLRGQALLAAGAYDDALVVADLKAWQMAGEVWHPGLVGIKAMALAGVGLVDLAQHEADRLVRTYPHHADTAEVMRFVTDRATASEAAERAPR